MPSHPYSIADQLRIKFVEGPLKNSKIIIDGSKTSFGTNSAENTTNHVELDGADFEVFFDYSRRNLMMHSLEHDPTSPGVLQKIEAKEMHELIPDDSFRIGNLEFHM